MVHGHCHALRLSRCHAGIGLGRGATDNQCRDYTGQHNPEWPKIVMHPNLFGSMRPLQFTVNAFPTLSHHAVSIPAIGPWRPHSAEALLLSANMLSAIQGLSCYKIHAHSLAS